MMFAFFKAKKATVWRSNSVFSSFLSTCYVWQDTLAFEDHKYPIILG